MKLDDLRAKLRARGTAPAEAEISRWGCLACATFFETAQEPACCPACRSDKIAPDIGTPAWRLHEKTRLAEMRAPNFSVTTIDPGAWAARVEEMADYGTKRPLHRRAPAIDLFDAIHCPVCSGPIERDRDPLAGMYWARCVTCGIAQHMTDTEMDNMRLGRR